MANRDVRERSAGLATDDSEPEVSPLIGKGRKKEMSAAGLLDTHIRLDEAEARLKEFDGSVPVRLLDPIRIRASHFQNRDEGSFVTPEFSELQEDIRRKGVNSTPIRVRRVSADPEHDYEIVYGHRRHRACLNLGVEVLAEIVEASEQQLYGWMTDENSKRNDLTPYEWGMHYKRGLDAKLFVHGDQLAEATGRTQAHVSYALAIARLPAEVLKAFPDPLAIQLKWGSAIASAYASDSEAVLAAARDLSKQEKRTAREVFDALTRRETGGGRTFHIHAGKSKVATLSLKKGYVSVRCARDAVPLKRVAELRRLLEEFFARRD
jgi:ParB family chromosome partitioning protein